MLIRVCLLICALCVSAGAEEATFAGNNPLVDQWKEELARLRSARKVQPMEGCLYSEKVAWKHSYDVGGGELMDKRRLQLKGGSPEAWKEGTALLLCYDETRGAYLLEPATGKRHLVRHISDRHPIDGYIESLNAYSTVDLLAAGEEAQRLWRLELDRSVREVLALRYLPAEVRANFIKLSKTRLDYLEQQSTFAVSAVYATFPGGTICGPASGNEINALYRSAYFQLSGLYEYYSSFNDKPEK